MHEPGHSGRGSGGNDTVVVIGLGAVGLGLGLGVGGGLLVLSQHMEPDWQVDVFAMITLGRSQKAAIIVRRQKPGQAGNFVCGGLVEGRCVVVVSVFSGTSATQQDPSPGQSASLSMLSQNNANSPLTHSPLHDLRIAGFGLLFVAVVATEMVVGEDVLGDAVVDDNLIAVVDFSSTSVEFDFSLSITSSSGGGESPYAVRKTQQRYPESHSSSTVNIASQ